MLASRRYTLDHLRLTAATVIGTGVPLVYYATLGKVDVNWKLAQIASKHAFPFWEIALAIAPLLLPAIVAYRTRPRTFLAIATRLWPLAAFAIFLLSGTSLGATPLHAFQGITLPLGVLAVEGIQLLGWLVPGKTGRRTYVGDCLCSEPNC